MRKIIMMTHWGGHVIQIMRIVIMILLKCIIAGI